MQNGCTRCTSNPNTLTCFGTSSELWVFISAPVGVRDLVKVLRRRCIVGPRLHYHYYYHYHRYYYYYYCYVCCCCCYYNCYTAAAAAAAAAGWWFLRAPEATSHDEATLCPSGTALFPSPHYAPLHRAGSLLTR